MFSIVINPRTVHRYVLAILGVLLASSASQAQDVTLFAESFDRISPPLLPSGWSSVPAGVWTTSSSVAGPDSEENNLVVSGGDSGAVFGPLMDFSDVTSASLVFNARRTSTFSVANLVIEASIDGGTTFPIVVADSGEAIPVATSSYEQMAFPMPASLLGENAVQLRIRALGMAGGNCRIDDLGITGSGEIMTSSIGFETGSTGVATGDTAVVPLDLTVLPAVGSLHGIQFDLEWSDSVSVVDVLRGPPVASVNDWDLAMRLDSIPGRVLLLSNGTTGLSPGTYDGILSLVTVPFELAGGGDRTDTLSIHSILGSRSEDTGDDAFVTGSATEHVLAVAVPFSTFEAVPDTIDFGLLAPDTLAFDSLLISNTTGNVPLVGTVSSDHAAIDVVPTSFSIEAGDSLYLIVSIDAAVSGPGVIGSFLQFEHNAESTPDTVVVSARIGVLNTRGDVNDDGVTDLVDLVLAIDHVVGNTVVDAELSERIDLHPFPDGDGGVDVRDLTVLVKAINQGIWPDGQQMLPSFTAGKAGSAGRADVYVEAQDGATILSVDYEGGLRALQLVLTRPGGLTLSDVVTRLEGEFVNARADAYSPRGAGFVSIIAYSLEGPISTTREFPFALITGAESISSDSLLVVDGMGVDLLNERVTLSAVSSMPDGGFPRFTDAFPQPFSIGHHKRIVIPSESTRSSEVHVNVTDVLGRTVHTETVRTGSARPYQWDLRTSGRPVVPGLYFISFSSESARQTVPVVIIR